MWLLVLLASVNVFRYLYWPFSPTSVSMGGDIFGSLAAPSWKHLFGTSSLGQDVFVRVVDGLWPAMLVIIGATLGSLIIGVALSSIAFLGGKTADKILSVLADSLNSLPSLLISLAILIGVPSDAEFRSLLVIFAVTFSSALFFGAKVFRTIRVNLARELQTGYYLAAKASGLSKWKIFSSHLLVNSTTGLRPLLTAAGSDGIVTLSGLGFVGVGVSATDGADWGYDLARGISDLSQGVWWTSLFPALAISLTLLCFAKLLEEKHLD